MLNKKFIFFSLMFLIITVGTVSTTENIIIKKNIQSSSKTNHIFEDVQNMFEKQKST